MLEDLTIKDFALIDSVSLEFTKGFNVLTGETGAGKSILIGALSFLLGGKADTSHIRTGATEARVSGTFIIEETQSQANAWMTEHGIEAENNRVLLRRTIRENGKSSAWIGDVPVTKNELSDFTSFLVDIHGQHEHQSLMKVSEHRKLLDAYAGIQTEVSAFTSQYATLVEKRKLLEQMNDSDTKRAEKIELLRFAVEEIEQANLKQGEEEELTAEETRLTQYEKLYGDIDAASELLQGGEQSAFSVLKKIRPFLERASLIDGTLTNLASRFENAFYELNDISDEVRSYKDTLVFDASRLEEVQERLALIFRLKKKYAQGQGSIADVLSYAQKAQGELENLSSWEGNKAELQNQVSSLEKSLYIAAKALSEKRRVASGQMAQKIQEVLSHLGMKGASFDAGLSIKPHDGDIQQCGPYGFDNIEFLISANVGSPLRPLAKIASGGELSRVMLAFKTILADTDTTPTLIFDEIDTGIGGEVAVSIGAHIRNLAKNHQILCISHLANIAVCADTHIKIEKFSDAQKTVTRVFCIKNEKRVEEIARMLAGDSADEASLEHARSLLSRYGG